MAYTCPYTECKKRLSSKYNLKRHIECCHRKIRKFECDICYKKFSSAQNLKEHLFLHENSNLKPLEKPKNFVPERDINIPMLTDMIFWSYDPDLRPMMKVLRLYPYPPLATEVTNYEK
ncbi:unnamed protein product [Blepharisma stoltei]|uniref:C2H2-type domain-containing protein n=1 Tax=Blepharisma stoltei TaxID=1481888 RepID=A0AAU9IQE6_9CILI|nr:unnamed protein product [Blepharisma stoltei]